MATAPSADAEAQVAADTGSGVPAPPAAPAAAVPPTLNVYKKIPVIRHPDDTLTYDAAGNVKTVSIQELGDAIATATPLVTPRPKLDIPVPRINTVASYARDVPANYVLPRSYVRNNRPTLEDLNSSLEYVADEEDENWLANNTKFGGSIPEETDKALYRRPQLSLELLQQMLDLLEKATGFEVIITFHQAETLILSNIPEIYHLFPIRARGAAAASSGSSNTGGVTAKTVLQDVYSMWVSKRSKLKRPLLRRFWPVTSTDDTNPHLVFRPREKEKYKLRKKRQNDMDAFLKMKQLRTDFDNLKVLLELVKRREELLRTHLQLEIDLFQQRLFEVIDTSGQPRTSTSSKQELKRAWDVPLYFDATVGKKAKRIRSSPTDSAPAAGASASALPSNKMMSSREAANRPASAQEQQKQILQQQRALSQHQIIAGSNHGEPAPLFVHPLPTRESYVSSWDNATPHVTTYVNSHAQPTFVFRHRPRVGRGGRVCIDRLPMPIDERVPPQVVLTAGRAVPQAQTKERLLHLLPKKIDNTTGLRQRLEEWSVAALVKHPHRDDAADHHSEENDGEEVIVKLDDWLQTDDQLWGEERFAIGPI